MGKSVGGRGKKAPYETTHVRVPLVLKSQIEHLVSLYHEAGDVQGIQPIKRLDEATSSAQGILLHKKSAKTSMEKLLTSIYGISVKL
jgi:hypothetical protein